MNKKIEEVAQRSCPECGGQRVVTQNHLSAGIVVYIGPFSTERAIAVSCTVCGYTSLFMEDPKKLRQYYLKDKN